MSGRRRAPAGGWDYRPPTAAEAADPARAELLEGIAEAACECRQRQQSYFRSRSPHDLELAKRAEGRLDQLLGQLQGPAESPLFGGPDL